MADGAVRPFIVRVETLTIDRGIAQVASVYDPAGLAACVEPQAHLRLRWHAAVAGTGREAAPSESCRRICCRRGTRWPPTRLNALEQNCNDVLAAEAFAMTREHVIEEFGAPAYTMGIGCSGGAAQAYQIADNYPGLLDGLVVGCSLADLGLRRRPAGLTTLDCCSSYLQRHPGVLNPAQQQAGLRGCRPSSHLAAMSAAARILEPVGAFDPVVPARRALRRRSNDRGALAHRSGTSRSTATAAMPVSVRARRPLGNIGVQYGLTGAAVRDRSRSLSSSSLNARHRRPGCRLPADRSPNRARRRGHPGGVSPPDGCSVVAAASATSRSSTTGPYGYASRARRSTLRHHTFVVQEQVERRQQGCRQSGAADRLGPWPVRSSSGAWSPMRSSRWTAGSPPMQASPKYGGHRGRRRQQARRSRRRLLDARRRKIAEPQTYLGPSRVRPALPVALPLRGWSPVAR